MTPTQQLGCQPCAVRNGRARRATHAATFEWCVSSYVPWSPRIAPPLSHPATDTSPWTGRPDRPLWVSSEHDQAALCLTPPPPTHLGATDRDCAVLATWWSIAVRCWRTPTAGRSATTGASASQTESGARGDGDGVDRCRGRRVSRAAPRLPAVRSCHGGRAATAHAPTDDTPSWTKPLHSAAPTTVVAPYCTAATQRPARGRSATRRAPVQFPDPTHARALQISSRICYFSKSSAVCLTAMSANGNSPLL